MPKQTHLIRMRDVPNIVHKITDQTRSKETIYLWAKKGITGHTGEIVKLETTKRMGRMFTTIPWIEEFIGKV